MGIRKEVLQEAEFILYEGGEIPEVCFWNSYFYLTSPSPEGLGLKLTKEEIKTLQKAVVERYMLIIQRDLTFEYIDKPFYRGIPRAIVNVQRLKNFLKNTGLEAEYKGLLRRKVKRLFKKFKDDLKKNNKDISELASKEELKKFRKEVEGL